MHSLTVSGLALHLHSNIRNFWILTQMVFIRGCNQLRTPTQGNYGVRVTNSIMLNARPELGEGTLSPRFCYRTKIGAPDKKIVLTMRDKNS